MRNSANSAKTLPRVKRNLKHIQLITRQNSGREFAADEPLNAVMC